MNPQSFSSVINAAEYFVNNVLLSKRLRDRRERLKLNIIALIVTVSLTRVLVCRNTFTTIASMIKRKDQWPKLNTPEPQNIYAGMEI